MKNQAHAPNLPVVDKSLLEPLPPVLRAVVRALGVNRAREWLMERGGRNVCVPLGRSSAMVQGLNQEEVERMRYTLANHMDENGRVTLPKADKLLNHFRDQQIRRERRKASLPALAHRYNLTVRQVLNICREDDPGKQFVLF